MLSDEEFNELHIAFDVREQAEVEADHHVHGALWFLGLETGQVLEFVVGDLGVFLSKANRVP